MYENEFKPIAREILRKFGLQLYDLKRGDLSTPDWEARGKRDKYVIELKIKDDDSDELAKELKALSQGGLIAKSTPVSPRNTLAGIICKGVKQMRVHDSTDESFRVIWLHSAGQDPELHNIRFLNTLFGTGKFVSLDHPTVMTCFYFHESAFYSWRDHLDGAFVTYLTKDGLHVTLCINTCSARVDQFRQSELNTTNNAH